MQPVIICCYGCTGLWITAEGMLPLFDWALVFLASGQWSSTLDQNVHLSPGQTQVEFRHAGSRNSPDREITFCTHRHKLQDKTKCRFFWGAFCLNPNPVSPCVLPANNLLCEMVQLNHTKTHFSLPCHDDASVFSVTPRHS